MDVRSREINENLSARKHMADKEVVKSTADRGPSSDRNIGAHRRAEQFRHQKDNAIADKITVADDAGTFDTSAVYGVPDASDNAAGGKGKTGFVMPPDTDLPPGMY